MYICVTIIIYFIVLRITGNGLLIKQMYYNAAKSDNNTANNLYASLGFRVGG